MQHLFAIWFEDIIIPIWIHSLGVIPSTFVAHSPVVPTVYLLGVEHILNITCWGRNISCWFQELDSGWWIKSKTHLKSPEKADFLFPQDTNPMMWWDACEAYGFGCIATAAAFVLSTASASVAHGVYQPCGGASSWMVLQDSPGDDHKPYPLVI
jgi:hypothetical protein